MTRKIFMLGAGAAGGSLAVSLKKAGFEIAGVCDPVRERAEKIAGLTDSKPYWDTSPDAVESAEISLIAVPDSKVKETAEEIARRGLNRPKQIWLHVSGSLSADVLKPLASNQSIIGAFHPAVAFPPGKITEIPPGAYFGVDGDEPAVAAAEEIAGKLGGAIVVVPARLRPLYHAANVLASNYVVALLWQANQALLKAGLDDGNVEPLLTSLASSALKRAGEAGIEKSLSGPIRRGDAETVKRHLEALEENSDAHEIYRVLGRLALKLCANLGDANVDSLDSIKKILAG